MMRLSFQLWHLFLLMGVVGSGLWAFGQVGAGGAALVAAWGLAAASVIGRQDQEGRQFAQIRSGILTPLAVLDAGFVVLLGYWLCFHFTAK